ncbi:hypothetical protein BGX38DRAFT_1298621 [Terfezia claveryi]|nr:hypothetical protein BGX38DRAFT_1298621 [Terfezia claveryi]
MPTILTLTVAELQQREFATFSTLLNVLTDFSLFFALGFREPSCDHPSSEETIVVDYDAHHKVLPTGVTWPSETQMIHIAQNSCTGDLNLDYSLKTISPSPCEFPLGILRHIFQEPDPNLDQHLATVTSLLGKLSTASSKTHVGAAANVLLNYLTVQCSRKLKWRFMCISRNPHKLHWLVVLQNLGLSDFSSIDFCSKISASGYIDVNKAWLDLAYLTL